MSCLVALPAVGPAPGTQPAAAGAGALILADGNKNETKKSKERKRARRHKRLVLALDCYLVCSLVVSLTDCCRELCCGLGLELCVLDCLCLPLISCLPDNHRKKITSQQTATAAVMHVNSFQRKKQPRYRTRRVHSTLINCLYPP